MTLQVFLTETAAKSRLKNTAHQLLPTFKFTDTLISSVDHFEGLKKKISGQYSYKKHTHSPTDFGTPPF